MQTPSPWATKADVEAPYVNLATMHADLRAVQAVLTELRDRRPWWRRLFTAGAMIAAVVAVSAEAQADFKTGNQLYADCTSEEGLALGCTALGTSRRSRTQRHGARRGASSATYNAHETL